jgi:hypothetical protein
VNRDSVDEAVIGVRTAVYFCQLRCNFISKRGQTYDHSVVAQIEDLLLFYTTSIKPQDSRAVNSPESESIFRSKFFQLCQDTISYRRYTYLVSLDLPFNVTRVPTLSHQAVHHALYKLDLVLNRKIDEIGIDQYTIWGSEIGVVRQEESLRISYSVQCTLCL